MQASKQTDLINVTTNHYDCGQGIIISLDEIQFTVLS